MLWGVTVASSHGAQHHGVFFWQSSAPGSAVCCWPFVPMPTLCARRALLAAVLFPPPCPSLGSCTKPASKTCERLQAPGLRNQKITALGSPLKLQREALCLWRNSRVSLEAWFKDSIFVFKTTPRAEITHQAQG